MHNEAKGYNLQQNSFMINQRTGKQHCGYPSQW